MEWDSATITRNARERLSNTPFVRIFFRQVFSERWTRIRTGVSFRSRKNDSATAAYCAMKLNEFEGINARQVWSNWRTVPRNLSGHVPSSPVHALDLCCGIGQSTEVLAWYLAPGSQILGIEYNPDFVEHASKRKYVHSSGAEVKAQFRAQSVLETFHDTEGREIAAGSIDVVNSCGAIGSHFDSSATERLSREVARVLRRGGLALIDCGLPGTTKKELIRIFEGQGFETLNVSRSCAVDPYAQVAFRKL